MRHRVAGKKLGRKSKERKSLFKNLVRSFFGGKGKISTTLVKAKAVQGLVEKVIRRSSKGDLNSRRWLFTLFGDQKAVNRLVETFGKQFTERNGGYTRIVKIKRRKGDNAVLARLELVEELAVEEKKIEKKEKKLKVKEKKSGNLPAKKERS